MIDIFLNQIIVSIFIGISSGISSILANIRRITLLSDVLAHVAFSGIIISLILNINPNIFGLIYLILNTIFIKELIHRYKFSEDFSISLILSANFSLSILMIYLGKIPSYIIFSYIFGNIFLIGYEELIIIFFLTMFIVLVMMLLYNGICLITVNDSYAKVSIKNYEIYLTLIYLIISLTIFFLIKIVGIILTIALISIPGYISIRISNGFKNSFLISSVITSISILLGLFLSIIYNLPPSPVIVFVLVSILLISLKKFF